MYYPVLISASEARLLSRLQNQRFVCIHADDWCSFISAGNLILTVLPEEVETPDAQHPHGDAVRIRIEESSGPTADKIAEFSGAITRISLLTIALSYSLPTPVEKTEIMGFQLPEGTGYHANYFDPDDPTCWLIRKSLDTALMLVDVGILLETERDRVVLATDGVGFFVHACYGDAQHNKLESLEGKMRRTPMSERY